MGGNSSRREFLTTASLAGAALVVGGSAGCAGPQLLYRDQIRVDSGGCIIVTDKVLSAELYKKWLQQSSGKPKSGEREGLCIIFDDPSGKPVNSLCNC